MTGGKDPVLAQRARELRENMTPQERILWNAVRRKRLGVHFRRQQKIVRFVVDFYCDVARLVVEIDGSVHEKRVEADAERSDYLRSLGVTVVRFTNDEIEQNLPGVLERLRALVART